MLKFSAYKPTNGLKYIGSSNDYLVLNLNNSKAVRDMFATDDFCKRVVKEVDKSNIVSPYLIISSVLGAISPSMLSGGSSTIITLYILCKKGRDDIFFRSSQVWNNCVPYLMELVDKYDITMWMINQLKITDELFAKYPNKVYCLDENRYINDSEDLYWTHNRWKNKRLDEEEAAEAYLFDEEWKRESKEITKRQLEEFFGREGK